MPLTPQDVRDQQFPTVRMRTGYDMDAVDAFLDQVESEISRLLSDNDELRSRLAQVQSQALRHDTSETPVAVAAAVETGPLPIVAAAPPVDAPAAALAMLEAAQRTADDTVAAARVEAERMLSEARQRAGSVTADLESERLALEEQVTALRSFERTYRQRLREYVANQLQNLDSIAAGATVEPALPDGPPLQPPPAATPATPAQAALPTMSDGDSTT
jgi:DivIVA domain-containing protein